MSFKQFLSNSGYFEYTQGHANAFGISIAAENVEEFLKYSNEALADIDFNENVYDVNFQRMARDEDVQNIIQDIYKYNNVWGQSNNTPLIYITDINLRKGDLQCIGKNKDTLKFSKNGIDYLKFFAKDTLSEIAELKSDNLKLEVVGKMNMNFWNGRYSPQIQITELDFKEDRLIDF